MLELKLGWQSLLKNKQLYVPFILASSFLTEIYYIFQAIINNDSLTKLPTAQAISNVMQVALIFIAMVIVVFMLYINNIVSKRRNKELGLYSMLGMTKANLFFLVLGIDVLSFIASLVLGLVIGLTFIKFALLGFVKLMGIKLIHLTAFSSEAFAATATFFVAIFAVLLLLDLIKLSQVRPIELWNSSKRGEKPVKNFWLTTILGVGGTLVLASGYYLSVTTKPTASVVMTFILAVVLVVCGTYALFTSASIFFLSVLKKKKAYYYKRNHFITVSGMLYRMKQNGVGLASICLLCTAAIVSMVATSSLMIGKNEMVDKQAPMDVMIMRKQITKKDYNRLDKLAQKDHVTLTDKKEARSTLTIWGRLVGNRLKTDLRTDINTQYLVTATPLADYNKTEKTNYRLGKNELLVYTTDNSFKQNSLVIKGQKYHVKRVSSFKYNTGNNTTFTGLILITKTAALAEALTGREIIITLGVNTTGPYKNRQAFGQEVAQALQIDRMNVTSKLEIMEVTNQFYGGLLFVGLMLSLTMLMTTAMVIYYKQVAEGYADRTRFKTMQQVGLSLAETKQAINSQVLMVFMLPIAVAILHLCFALPALANVLKLFGMYNLTQLLVAAIVMVVLFLVVYLLIYGLTTRVYRRIVNNN